MYECFLIQNKDWKVTIGKFTLKVFQMLVPNGGLAQSVECALCKREAPGSKPGFSIRSYSVMVITLDFESSDPGSNPGRTFFCQLFNYSLQAVMLFILQISELKQVEM